jgi:hypothetical protein
MKMICSTTSAFSIVADFEFKKLWDMLRPGLPVPDRHKVAEQLLPELFEMEKYNIANETTGKKATLAIDGCNSAGLERSFSTMRQTYGETQLGAEQAGKLAFLHRLYKRSAQ